MARSLALLLAAAFAAATPLAARATVIVYPNGATTSASKPCTELAGSTCSTTAYFDSQSLDDQNDETISGTFESEFAAWNAMNAANAKWSLDFGGNLNGTFKVTLAAAALTSSSPGFCAGNNPAGATCGGLQIRIFISGMTLPAVGNNQIFGWTQGAFTNYIADTGTIVKPYYELDGTPPPDCGGAKHPICLPMYGFQYPDYHFFDAPAFQFRAEGPQAFFDATAYLALADYTARTLTVYDGLSYSFSNAVATPEAPAWALLIVGFGWLGAAGAGRRPARLRS